MIRQAKEQEVGVISVRPPIRGVFHGPMAETFPEIVVVDVGRLLLKYVISDLKVDVKSRCWSEVCATDGRESDR